MSVHFSVKGNIVGIANQSRCSGGILVQVIRAHTSTLLFISNAESLHKPRRTMKSAPSRHVNAIARRILTVSQSLLMLSLEFIHMTPILSDPKLLLLHSTATEHLSVTNRASLISTVDEELEIATDATTVDAASERVSLGAGSRRGGARWDGSFEVFAGRLGRG